MSTPEINKLGNKIDFFSDTEKELIETLASLDPEKDSPISFNGIGPNLQGISTSLLIKLAKRFSQNLSPSRRQ